MGADTRKGLTIYRAADAPRLEETDLMAPMTVSAATVTDMTETMAEAGAWAQSDQEVRVLVRQSADEGGFSLTHAWFKADYVLPRHSHSGDCMYYVVSGELSMGAQTLRAGDAFFLPSDAPYAYQAGPDGVEVLEIRRGLSSFDMQVPDGQRNRFEALAAAAIANGERWQVEEVSPTMAANRG